MARQPVVGELVVLAGLGDIPVAGDAQAGGAVERTGGDADRRAPGGVPEQARAALRAEAAARAGVATWAVDSAQPSILEQHEILAPRSRARGYVAVPAPAFPTVADEDIP